MPGGRSHKVMFFLMGPRRYWFNFQEVAPPALSSLKGSFLLIHDSGFFLLRDKWSLNWPREHPMFLHMPVDS